MENEKYTKSQDITGAVAGFEYEKKLAILFILRALIHGILNYKLASNIKVAGKFDDLAVEYECDDKDSFIFLQAKHIVSREITINETQLLSGDKFGIKKYFQSYKAIKKNYNRNGEYHFIFYTNISIDQNFITDYFKKSNHSKVSSILRTSGDVYEVQKDKINVFIKKFINLEYQNVDEEKTEEEDFISHLKFFVNQSNNDEINTDIEKDILFCNIKNDIDIKNEVSVAKQSKFFYEEIKKLTESDKIMCNYITENSSFYIKSVVKTFDNEHRSFIANKNISYESDAISELKDLIQNEQYIEIAVPVGALLVGEAKVIQCLNEYTNDKNKKYYFLKAESFLKCNSKFKKIFEEEDCGDTVLVSISAFGPELKTAISEMLSLFKYLNIILIHELNLSIDIEMAIFFRYEDKKLTLNYCSMDFRSEILGKFVKFQSEAVELMRIVNTDSLDCIDGKTISDIVNGNSVRIGKELRELTSITSFYITRKFVHGKVIKIDIFSDESVFDIFVFNQKDIPALKSLLPKDFGKLEQNVLCGSRNNVFITSEKNVSDFKNNMNLKGEDVHFLEIHSNKCVWVKTEGSVCSLLKYAEDYPVDLCVPNGTITETELARNRTDIKMVILADTAGTGKSTLLTSIGNQIKVNYKENNEIVWIIELNLNGCTREMQEYVDKKTQISDEFELLLKLSQFDSEVEKTLLRYWCKTEKNVIILFDGFDEILSEYQNLIIKLIKNLQKLLNLSQMYVASRPEMKSTLETKLNVFSYSLVQLSDDECRKYLVNFWHEEHKKKNTSVESLEEIKLKATLVTENLTKIRNCNDKYSFIGIPLQVKMAADIYSGKVLASDLEIELLDKNSFYQLFFDKKIKLFCTEKNRLNLTLKGNIEIYKAYLKYCDTQHQLISIHELLTEEEKSILLNDDKIKKLKKILTGEINIVDCGLINDIQDEKVIFIHRTFAEFFMAKFIVKKMLNCSNDKIYEMIHYSILIEEKFKVTRSFVNYGLKPDSFSSLGNFNIGSKHMFVDKVLYVAAKENNVGIMSYLLNSTQSDETIICKLINYTGSYNNTPLHEALERGHLDAVKLTLKYKIGNINSKNDDKNTALHLAAKGGHVDVVNSLLQGGACINEKEKYGNTALLTAACRGHVGVVKLLLEGGADINDKSMFGRTALHVAAVKGSVDVVKLLLQSGSDVNDKNEIREKALHEAAERGHVDVVELLLQSGADVNYKNKIGCTALYNAARGGYFDVVKLLLQSGADINDKDQSGFSAPYWAAGGGHVDVVELLLQVGANFKDKDENGVTALQKAAGNGHVDVVKLLIQSGADINEKDVERALHMAAVCGHVDVVKFLLQSGADINDKDQYGDTALHNAALGGDVDVVKLLLQDGANINDKSKEGDTALHDAAYRGHIDVVRLLLRAGADYKDKCIDGYTALHNAAGGGNVDVVNLLLQKGANVNDKNKNGDTALPLAAFWGYVDVAELLLQAGADVNDKNKGGHTALHEAACGGHVDMIELLLRGGAVINDKDVYGRPVLHEAARKGHVEVVNLLLQVGADFNVKNENGDTALHVAAFVGQVEVVKLLLRGGADINDKNNFGKTALHDAANNIFSSLKTVKCLVENNCDLNIMNNKGFTASELANKRGHREIVDFLTSAGAIAPRSKQ